MSGDEAFGVYSEGGARVAFMLRLPASIERVWSYVIEPDLRATWFYGGEIEPYVGGAVRMADDIVGVVTELEPPLLFAFTWRHPTWDSADSDVRIELTPMGNETLLTLTHSRMVGADRTANAIGWHAHLEALSETITGRVSPDRRAIETMMSEEYRRRLSA